MVTVRPLWILLIVAIGLLAGYYAGRRRGASDLKRIVLAQMKGRYLGNVLQDEGERLAMASAYIEPDRAIRELDTYPWDPSCIPTPFVGYAPAPSADPRLAINSFQFRAKGEVAIPKPVDRLRVFLVGGSTAFGSGAPGPDSTIGGYLEATLNGMVADAGLTVEVFTVAATAWASSHERIMLENRVSELEPDIVVCLSGYNDAHWAWNSENVLWFRAYFERHFLQVMETAYTAADVAFPGDAARAQKVPDISEITRILLKNVGLALHSLPGGASYVFALQPFIYACGKALTQRESAFLDRWHPVQTAYYLDCYQRFRESLSKMAEAGAMGFFDLTDVFVGRDAEEIFLDSTHFGDRGNAILARRLANDLAALVVEKAKAIPRA